MSLPVAATSRTRDTRERLAATAISLLEREGQRGVSARSLSRETGVSVSAMNYSFGGRQGLLEAAFAAATDQGVAWWGARVAQLGAGSGPRVGAGWLSATLFEARQDRALPSLVISELLQAAPRDEALRGIAETYQGRIDACWREAALRMELPFGAGRVLADYVAGALSSAAWSGQSSLDLPWAVDSAARLVARLEGGRTDLPGWDGWSELKQQALPAPPPQTPPVSDAAERMLAAAVELIACSGLQALTHRAVAAGSGCSLANVAYHFPTHEVLVERTFANVFHRVLAIGAVPDVQLANRSADADTLADDTVTVVLGQDGAPTSFFMVVRALMLEAERSGPLSGLAAGLLAEAEISSARSLRAIEAHGPYDRLDAHLAVIANGGAIQATLSIPASDRRVHLKARVSDQVRRLFTK